MCFEAKQGLLDFGGSKVPLSLFFLFEQERETKRRPFRKSCLVIVCFNGWFPFFLGGEGWVPQDAVDGISCSRLSRHPSPSNTSLPGHFPMDVGESFGDPLPNGGFPSWFLFKPAKKFPQKDTPMCFCLCILILLFLGEGFAWTWRGYTQGLHPMRDRTYRIPF